MQRIPAIFGTPLPLKLQSWGILLVEAVRRSERSEGDDHVEDD